MSLNLPIEGCQELSWDGVADFDTLALDANQETYNVFVTGGLDTVDLDISTLPKPANVCPGAKINFIYADVDGICKILFTNPALQAELEAQGMSAAEATLAATYGFANKVGEIVCLKCDVDDDKNPVWVLQG